jgi:hypothetical protein
MGHSLTVVVLLQGTARVSKRIWFDAIFMKRCTKLSLCFEQGIQVQNEAREKRRS